LPQHAACIFSAAAFIARPVFLKYVWGRLAFPYRRLTERVGLRVAFIPRRTVRSASTVAVVVEGDRRRASLFAWCVYAAWRFSYYDALCAAFAAPSFFGTPLRAHVLFIDGMASQPPCVQAVNLERFGSGGFSGGAISNTILNAAFHGDAVSYRRLRGSAATAFDAVWATPAVWRLRLYLCERR